MNMNLEEFREKVSKLPIHQQVEAIKCLFDVIYSGFDDKVFRVMASAVKFAKETETEGHEKFQVADKELEKLTHIQDKNRFHQNKMK
jgi:hypothetical protein